MTRPRDISAAAELARNAAPNVAALALDVISRQAEGKTLFAGEEFVQSKKETHGVEDGRIGDFDVLATLTRGPKDEREFALVMALAVEGLRHHLEDGARVKRFLDHADWLSFATSYPAYDLVEPVLEKDATSVWAEVRRSLGKEPTTKRESAVQALRRAALDQSSHGSSPSEAPPLSTETLAGELERAPREGFGAVLRLVTGWALLQWLGRGLLRLARFERRATLEQTPGGLRLEQTTSLLGREVRSRSEDFTYSSLRSLGATTRFPRAAFLAGAVCFGVGVFLGGFWLFEGVRSGETVLLLAGAGVVGLGAALDLALTSFWPGRSGDVSLELYLVDRPGWRIGGLDAAQAERFASAVAKASEGRAS